MINQWSNTIYVCFTDRAQALQTAILLGAEFTDEQIADGPVSVANGHYSLIAPIESPWATPPEYNDNGIEISPGVIEEGYWAMLRLNTDWEGYETTLAGLEAAGCIKTPVYPRQQYA